MTTFSTASLGGLLRAGTTQQDRLLVLHTPLGANKLLAERLDGVESLDDGGFRFELTALSDDANIELKTLMGQGVRLDLQTAQSRTELRPFHGHVTEAECVASNGGMARYRLVIEPWLAFLRHRQDSCLFQHQSVFDIVDAVFARYQSQGKLAVQWRWELAQRDIYPVRGITTQYHESDFDFVSRLLAEEGLCYWFEHATGKDGDLGSHTLVIADHNGAFRANTQAAIRFHRADASEREDTIQQWRGSRQLQTNSLAQQSWDYKSVSARPVQQQSRGAGHRTLQWSDDPGAYGWETSAQGERLLSNALQALELRNKRFEGQSAVRTLAPATTFSLTGHEQHDKDSEEDRRFAVLAVRHIARNNFDEDLKAGVGERLGLPDIATVFDASDDDNGQDSGNAAAKPDTVTHYRNDFTAVRAAIPYRPLSVDGHGQRIHPKPSVYGSQSAIVVGVGENAPVHTDRDHRVKVQFHWQRGSGSSARQPRSDGQDNAPASDRLGAWVRVAAGAAGDNWGQVTLPRVGQEVLVEFHNGDIDRPVVVAALYNGAGQTDAQHNEKSAGAAQSTGNAPAWFAGEGKEAKEHAHNAVFSGIKTQELSASQSGDGGYNQLVFDDTPGQGSTSLATTQAQSRLHLGHHKQQDDNARGKARGHGAELATTAQGAIRAGAGLLVSAHAQTNAKGAFMASREAQQQTKQAEELATSLAKSAQTQKAQIKGEEAPDKLPAIEALKHVAEVLGATQEGSATASSANGNGGDIKATEGGQGSVTAYSEPHLQFSAPMGIGFVTPKEVIAVSGKNTAIVASQDIDLPAQGQIAVSVAKGVSLYTMGAKANEGQEPNQERGIALHAASGSVTLQSQKGATKIAADKKVTIASVTKNVEVEAPTHVLLTSAGAYVKLEGSSIKIHAPGKVTFRGMHNFVGPQGDSASNSLPTDKLAECEWKT
ncbi:type VI secretion system VgrG family protein [Variovorax boronicumulans]|uniref:type VI secretion system Vgr family protein n=2 Tax=Variovorax boronicumulans TaxID=436515 RepID=UPI0027889125|nr:type VI secretion system Vgr family protein [Variovorax boronicumulans]MDP9994666.1 type VI secretion system VgrG family protein [Variovorax boronicumulans]MDQ0005992.1 type VI secretion system VgrG family protein [Variovorax boronicumulans]